MFSSLAALAAGVVAVGGGFFGYFEHHDGPRGDGTSTQQMMATSTDDRGDHMGPPRGDDGRMMGTSTRPEMHEGTSTEGMRRPPIGQHGTSTPPRKEDDKHGKMSSTTPMRGDHDGKMGSTTPPMMHGDMREATGTEMRSATGTEMREQHDMRPGTSTEQGTSTPRRGFFQRFFNFFGRK